MLKLVKAIKTDVLILGAGPAGSTCAEVCARAGLDVVVIEKRNTDWEKPCGGGITERVLQEFDIPTNILDRHPMTLLIGTGGKNVVTIDEKPQGGNVMRATFDSYLASRLVDAGGKLLENTAATKVSIKDHRITEVTCRSPKGSLKLHADIVVDATGTPPFLARKLGLYNVNPSLQVACRQYHLSMPDELIDNYIGNRNELYFGTQIVPEFGYAWIFPKRGIVSVGIGTMRRILLNRNVDLQARLDWFLTKHPVASKKLRHATSIIKRQAHLIGFTGLTTPIYGPNWLITGEAAGFVSYVTGEGLYYGMVAGREAANTAIRAIKNGQINKTTLKTYKTVTDRLVGSDMKWGPYLHKMFLASPWIQQKVLKSAINDYFFTSLIADLIGGNLGYRTFYRKLFLRIDKLLKAAIKY